MVKLPHRQNVTQTKFHRTKRQRNKISEEKTLQKENITRQNFIQIQCNKTKRHTDKLSLDKTVNMMTTENDIPIRNMSQKEICYTDKMADHMIKAPLRQNATSENCHVKKRHFDTLL